MIKKIILSFAIFGFVAVKSLQAGGPPAYFGVLRAQISNQLVTATNSAAPSPKLIRSLKKSLFLIDHDSKTNLTVHTRTLGLVAGTLNKTSLSNLFDGALQNVVDQYYNVVVSTKSSLVFPAEMRPANLRTVNLLDAALHGADTNPNTVVASKYLSLAARRLIAVERFAIKSQGNSLSAKPSSNPPALTPPPSTSPAPAPTPPPTTTPPIPTPTPPPAPAPTSDLSQQINQVFVAGEGFNTLQFAPNGKLGFIVWRGRDLLYRERNGSSWTERVIGNYGSGYSAGGAEEYRFQPYAALLFDSQSRAHILRQNGGSFAHHVQQGDGRFSENSAIPVSGSSFSLITVAMGPGDKLHIALVGSGSYPSLDYGTDKNGSWQWSQATTIAGNPRGFLRQSYAPRWFSMAIDSGNNAHLTYCPEFANPAIDGHSRPYSQLNYASNRGGGWTTQKINSTPDDSGDVGAGASIAIAPDDQPAIANWYNERAATGSSQYNQLYYFKRDGSGNWSKQLVVGSSAGYLAGDGDKGAGFAPYLRFDPRGRPNIAFCDDASEHFAVWGQNEFAGDLRHAYLDGGNWKFRTIYQQGRALDAQIVYPAVAFSGSEMVFTGLERKTSWIDSRRANSTYKWFYIQSGLP